MPGIACLRMCVDGDAPWGLTTPASFWSVIFACAPEDPSSPYATCHRPRSCPRVAGRHCVTTRSPIALDGRTVPTPLPFITLTRVSSGARAEPRAQCSSAVSSNFFRSMRSSSGSGCDAGSGSISTATSCALNTRWTMSNSAVRLSPNSKALSHCLPTPALAASEACVAPVPGGLLVSVHLASFPR